MNFIERLFAKFLDIIPGRKRQRGNRIIRLFVIFLFPVWFLPGAVLAQDKPILPLFVAPDLDTNYIELNRDSWSIRAFSSFKFHSLMVGSRESNQRYWYRPNDLFGVGLGFAYKFVLVDIGIGLDLEPGEATNRFDMQTNLILGQRHLFDIALQYYKGFEDPDRGVPFRDDIRTFFGGINYTHYFNYRQLSMRSVFRGDFRQKKSAWSPIVGGYASFSLVRADSSLIPEGTEGYPPAAFIEESEIPSAGILGGAAFTLVFPQNFFWYGGAVPGIGFQLGEVEATDSYSPRWAPVTKVNARTAVGYSHPKFYVVLAGVGDIVFPNLARGVRYQYNFGRIKLLLGWRMNSRIGLLEKINRAFRGN